VRSEERERERLTAELEIWLNSHDLIINVSKTGFMSFHNRLLKFLVKTSSQLQ